MSMALALFLLAAAVLLVPLFRFLKLGAVLGYLTAGMLLGPAVTGLVTEVDILKHVSELGVVLLMFVIGLEMQPSRLWVLRRQVFGLGGLQVGLTTLALGALGYAYGYNAVAAFTVAVGLAMSSTAFVLQSLSERQQLPTQHGQDAFSTLLFQDLAVIPLLAILPLLAPIDMRDGVSVPGLLAIATVIVVIFAGRYLLRPALRFLAKSGNREIFTAAALLLVIGTATLMEAVHLSMSLGAFLAGVLLADSEFRHELEANIEPFKGLLLGLFFMAVGMTVNLNLITTEPLKIILLVLGLMLIKGTVLWLIAKLAKRQAYSCRSFAFALCQGGEFAFVLFGLAEHLHLISTGMNELWVVVVTVSMLVAPFALLLQDTLEKYIAQPTSTRPFDTPESENPVIIAGFGRFGQVVSRVLMARKISFTVLEKNPEQVDFVRKFGSSIHYGDASRPELLHAAGLEHAKAFVLAIDDMTDSLKTAEYVRYHFPDLPIYARARNRVHAFKLMEIGVTLIERETFQASLATARSLLEGLGDSAERAAKIVNTFEAHDINLLKRQYAVHGDDAKLIQTSRESRDELKNIMEADWGESDTTQ